MNAIFTLLLSGLLCLGVATGLAGCKDSSEATQQDSKVVEYDQVKIRQASFERMRKTSREFLTKESTKNPDGTGFATLSLKDYINVSYLEEFEKKYPNLKIIRVMLIIKGANLPAEPDPGLPLKSQLDAAISFRMSEFVRELQKSKDLDPKLFSADEIKRAIASAQEYVDAINAGNVRTYGFAVQGKFKDIEEMARKEYNGKEIRVINVIDRISTGELPFYPWDPIYSNDGKPLDRNK